MQIYELIRRYNLHRKGQFLIRHGAGWMRPLKHTYWVRQISGKRTNQETLNVFSPNYLLLSWWFSPAWGPSWTDVCVVYRRERSYLDLAIYVYRQITGRVLQDGQCENSYSVERGATPQNTVWCICKEVLTNNACNATQDHVFAMRPNFFYKLLLSPNIGNLLYSTTLPCRGSHVRVGIKT